MDVLSESSTSVREVGMELQNKDDVRNGILQSWLRAAWVNPVEGPNEQVYLRLTPGGRLKMRRRIKELENSLGESGAELVKQEEAGTLPVEREKMELAMMAQAYTTERKFIKSQGGSLGSAIVEVEDHEEPPRGGPIDG
jgi:hypothetical protein